MQSYISKLRQRFREQSQRMRVEFIKRQRKTLGLYEEEVAKIQTQLRTVVDRSVPVARKKKLIIQRDGLLVPLLTAVVSTLAALIYESLKK